MARRNHYGLKVVASAASAAAPAMPGPALDPERYKDMTTLYGGEAIAAELQIPVQRFYKIKHKNRGAAAPPVRHVDGAGLIAVRGPLLAWWDRTRGLIGDQPAA